MNVTYSNYGIAIQTTNKVRTALINTHSLNGRARRLARREHRSLRKAQFADCNNAPSDFVQKARRSATYRLFATLKPLCLSLSFVSLCVLFVKCWHFTHVSRINEASVSTF